MRTFAVRKKRGGFQVVSFKLNTYFTNHGYCVNETDVDGGFFNNELDAENFAMNCEYEQEEEDQS
jgi:hypothetical protein